jgi:hypothetical protein
VHISGRRSGGKLVTITRTLTELAMFAVVPMSGVRERTRRRIDVMGRRCDASGSTPMGQPCGS